MTVYLEAGSSVERRYSQQLVTEAKHIRSKEESGEVLGQQHGWELG